MSDLIKQTIDKLVQRFYGCFNTTKVLTIDDVYELFVPEGVIVKNISGEPEIYDLRSFVEPRRLLISTQRLRQFSEWEIAERTLIAGNLAQRFSVYGKKGYFDGEKVDTRGVKTFQFIRTPIGWKIMSMAWDDEREGFAVDSYMPN